MVIYEGKGYCNRTKLYISYVLSGLLSISSTLNFLYECRFGSLESGFERTFVRKMYAKNIDEIDDWLTQWGKLGSS